MEVFSFPESESALPPSFHRGGLNHFALEVEKREALFGKLKAAGYHTSRFFRNGHWSLFVRDPDGVWIELRDKG